MDALIYERRRSEVPSKLLELGMNDAMTKRHIDGFIVGHFPTVQDMLVCLALELAKEKKAYFDRVLRFTELMPAQTIFVVRPV